MSLLVLAAPFAAVVALVAVDLISGGDSHLSRSVLDAGGLHEVGQVFERRLRLGAASFSRFIFSPYFLFALAAIAVAIVFRRRVDGWLRVEIAAWAGFVGAASATVVGTLANDSGALLLMVGTGYLAVFVGLCWASRSMASARESGLPLSRPHAASLSSPPYSWTYEGGVNRHTQELAEHLLDRGNEVRVLAPYDPPDRLTKTFHRGAVGRDRPLPDYLVPLGRTVRFSANGSASNLAAFPSSLTTLRRELRAGDFDVVHVQEPPGPLVGWDACSFRGAPVVGTFHAYSTRPGPNILANLVRGAAKVQPAAREDRRLGGGCLDRAPLVRGRVRDHPERGRAPGGSQDPIERIGRRWRAPHPLRRSRR